MWHEIAEALGLVGAGDELGASQSAVRAAVIYLILLLSMKVGRNRLLGKHAAFDIVFGLIFGSLLSRSINGGGHFYPTLIGAITMLAIHNGLGLLALRWHRFSDLIRGEPEVLARDGTTDRATMRRQLITKGDIEEALRKNGHERLDEAHVISLERDGSISVITAKEKRDVKVVEIDVRDGVQTVRLEIG